MRHHENPGHFCFKRAKRSGEQGKRSSKQKGIIERGKKRTKKESPLSFRRAGKNVAFLLADISTGSTWRVMRGEGGSASRRAGGQSCQDGCDMQDMDISVNITTSQLERLDNPFLVILSFLFFIHSQCFARGEKPGIMDVTRNPEFQNSAI